MTRPFNLARIKQARRFDPPKAFQPPVMQGDPYAEKKPGDGQGNALNTPGDEGIAGAPPSGTGFGRKDRREYPSGISAFDDPADKGGVNNDIPADQDPSSPFSSEALDPGTPFGTGIVTDYGLELHDSNNPQLDDSVLGRHQTIIDKIDGNDRDRTTPLYNLNQTRPLFDRIRKRQKG